jgi:hypothetical protein
MRFLVAALVLVGLVGCSQPSKPVEKKPTTETKPGETKPVEAPKT